MKDWEDKLKKEFEKFIEYEICDNPDHGFIEVIPGDVSRLGCPLCGHDEEHRILSTQRFNEKPEAVWSWFESNVESLLKKQREKYYYEIENSTGTKEADYIDKQVNGGSESKLKLVLTIRQ